MVKVAKIVNKYGKSYMVPIFRAKQMLRNEDIEDYELIEVKKTKNFEKPKTQKEFERGFDGGRSAAELENEALREQISLLKQKQSLETKPLSIDEKIIKAEEEIKVIEEIKIVEAPKNKGGRPKLNK